MKKIGIYGGSFNPIHNGHIYMARYAVKVLKLDKLIIVPVGKPSHRNDNLVDGQKRLEMCRLAFKDDIKIEVSDIEIKSNKISYTFDTLLDIMELYPDSKYYEIIGEDSGEYFHKWKNYEEILKKAKIVIFRRKGYSTLLKNKNILEIKNDFLEYSSTEIRANILKGESIENMLPKDILEYIKEYNLYKEKR